MIRWMSQWGDVGRGAGAAGGVYPGAGPVLGTGWAYSAGSTTPTPFASEPERVQLVPGKGGESKN